MRLGRGFSLIELVVVMAILAVIAAIAAPRYGDAVARYRAVMTARRVAADLNRARTMAITRSKPCVVTFNATSGWYSVNMSGSVTTEAETVLVTGSPYNARIQQADFGGATQVTYDMYGTPSAAGTVSVASGAESRTVVVDVASGKAVAP